MLCAEKPSPPKRLDAMRIRVIDSRRRKDLLRGLVHIYTVDHADVPEVLMVEVV